ncbi:hypothetical protein F4678DRAFT_470332 [Xylaria arbuscula]|nr:hypothetical protein F4678DRAFT_470332 [Xylaria arbuscula]
MAAPVQNNGVSIRIPGDIDDDSDYGSDFSAGEEQLVEEILAGLAGPGNATAAIAITTIAATAIATPASHTPTTVTAREAHTTTATASRQNHNGEPHAPLPVAAGGPSSHTPRPAGPLSFNINSVEQGTVSWDPIRYPDLSRALSSLDGNTQPAQEAQEAPPHATEREPDTRTPLQRFRTFPKRPLTVSDFATGSWCELQHWFTLTRLPGGRKTKTAAMKGGSRVHQTLEDEVHSTVEISIASKEEAFALRLWNIIQGMRTLRDTGMTRELEVWGIIEGEVLNGIIDQLNHATPNASFEEEINLTSSNPSSQQSAITDYMSSSHKTVYLTDVKTRGSTRLPKGWAVRPARVQLLLYHRLLSDMAADKLDYTAIFERYGLNGEARFSDAFMAQIGGLHDEIFYDADSEIEEKSAEREFPDLIGYRSISQIIPLLKAELRETFPLGPASISDLLAVEYRHRGDGRFIGNNSFKVDPEALDFYMKHSMQFWRGEREPEGILTIEEADKCKWCEFAEICQWRVDKELEFLKNKKRKAKAIAKHA